MVNRRRYPSSQSRRGLGLASGVASGASYGFMVFLIHVLAGKLPAWEITFVRAICAVVVLLPLVIRKRRHWFGKASWLLWIRSGAGAVSLFCLAWNLQHTSVGFANTLFNFAPIFVVIAGSLAGHEKFQISRFLNVGLIVLASTIFWYGSRSGITSEVWIVGLVGMISAAVAYAMLKSIPVSWNSFDITWGMNFATLPVALIFKSGPWLVPHGSVTWLLFAICVFSLIGNALVNVSFRNVELSAATALVPSSIIWGVLLDMGVHSFPPVQGVVGCVLYLAAICRLAVRPAQGAEAATAKSIPPIVETSESAAS